VTVAARFPVRFEADPNWNGTEIALPRTTAGNTRWRDLVTGRIVDSRGADALPVEALLRDLPVAVLVPDNG